MKRFVIEGFFFSVKEIAVFYKEYNKWKSITTIDVVYIPKGIRCFSVMYHAGYMTDGVAISFFRFFFPQ